METYMEINKETAHRLWVQQFGRTQKAIDFAGREIAKAAYNNRSSDFGWNVDHILPQSRGGKTADHNLICCHILTNDEKADRFPCFKANRRAFEVQKRQNHYEIIEKTAAEKTKNEPTGRAVDFFDAAQGIAFWKKCESSDSSDEDSAIGCVKVMLDLQYGSDRLLDQFKQFLMSLFGTELVFVEKRKTSWRRGDILYTVWIPAINSAYDFLNDCIVLNTYADYFKQNSDVENIWIICGAVEYHGDINQLLSELRYDIPTPDKWSDSLIVDDYVKNNAHIDGYEFETYYVTQTSHTGAAFWPCDCIDVELAKDLEKLI